MNRQTTNTKGLLGVASRMMVAFILLVAGFGFASVAQAQLSASGPATLFLENCSPPNNAVDPGETVQMTFTVTNNTANALANVLVALQASGHVVSPSPSFAVIGNIPPHTTASLNFNFTASGVCGVDQVTPTLTFAGGATGSTTFPGIQLGATVPTPHTVSNSGAIAIPGNGSNGPSFPNPSTITVSGFTGTVKGVKLNLVGLSHGFPDDLNVLLVGPQGQKVFVMGDAGGNVAIPVGTPVNLTFDDAAANKLPDEAQIVSGSYKVSQYDTTIGDDDTFPNPAPSAPYSSNLAVFDGQDPNGTWSLFIFDDSAGPGSTGTLAGGWSLDIPTSLIACCKGPAVPKINNDNPIPDTSTPEDTSTQFIINASDDATPATNLVVSVTGNTNPTLVPNSNIAISIVPNSFQAPNSAQFNITLTPAPNQNGKTKITITLTDTDGFSDSRTFELTVNAVNDNPTISSIPSQAITMSGATGVIPFTVADQPNETPADQLQVLASSSNIGLVPNNKIVLGGSGNNRTIQITPNTNVVGTTTITVQVADLDGGFASTSFSLLVGIAAGLPFISTVPDQTANEDQSISIGISVGDAETPANQLFLTATSSNPGLVPLSNIAFDTTVPSSPVVTLTPVAHQFGTTTITLIVRDTDGNTASTTFKATFGFINHPPVLSISNIKPNTLIVGGNGDVTGTSLEDFAITADLTIDDVESGSSGVTVTTSSSDPILIPTPNILISGSGSSRKLTIIPVANLYDQPRDAGAGLTQPNVTITITVNDNSGLTTTHTLTFTVVSVNDAPHFTKGPDINVLEDSGGHTFANWSPNIDSGAPNESQVRTVIILANSNTNLFTPNGQPAFNTFNTLTFTNAPNADGSALITVVVKDDGGTANGGVDTSAPQSFLINVTPVNDQPSFALAFNQTTLNEDTIGVVTLVPAPVILIDPGAGGAGSEASQTLTFSISNDHPEFFKTQPSIKINGANGDLSFEVATNAFGDATLKIKLVDNGGTANGGVDTSATQQFTIRIQGVDDPPSISTIPNVTTGKSKDSPVTLFTVNDPDVINQGVLAVTFTHTSGATLAQNFSLGVSGGTRALIITPFAGLIGTETITASVADVNAGAPFYLNPPPFPPTTTTFTFTVTDLNNPPTISPATLPDLSAIEDAASIASPTFTVNDIETPPANISVTAKSSDQTLVQDSGIFIANGVNPGDRIAIITPVANASTTNGVIITITATDQAVPPGTGALAAQSTSKSFKLILTPVNDTPIIAATPNNATALKKSTQEDVPVVIPFTVDDPEDLNNLTFLLTSTNQALVKDANIVLAGTGTNRTVTVTPELNASGVTDISIGVHDPANTVTNFVIFSLTVNPVNDPPIIVGGLPSAQSISENQTLTLTFDISDVETPSKLLVLTRATGNTNVVLDTGIVFDNSAAFTNSAAYSNGTRRVTITPIPNRSGSAPISISITDNGVAGPPSLPAVTSTYTFTLNVGAVDSFPTITPIADITIDKNTSTPGLAFTINDAETDVTQLSLSTVVGASPADLIPAGGIVISGTGANRTIKVTPAKDKVGTAVITITVTDSIGQTKSSSFTLSVKDVNTAPTISKIADQVTNEDTDTALIPFTVGDAESVNSLTLTATSSNPVLVPDQNVFFGGSGVNRALFITPAPNQPLNNQSNITFITVTVSDGSLTNATTFKLTVNPVNDIPTISAIPNQNTQIGQAITGIKFVVGDVETAAAFLNVVPTSSNQALVANGSMFQSGTGTNRSLSIFPAAGQSGQTLITVTVTDDQGGSAKSQFLVVVGGVPAAVANDFNSDGFVDIVFQADDGSVGVWFMNNGPDLASANLFNPGNVGDPGWRIVGTGDFNNDTKTDLLYQHTDGTLAVWLLDGINLVSAQLLTPTSAGPDWSVVATGDINKDGKRDIIFQHTDGTLGAWLMNGTTLVDSQLFTPNNPGTGWRVVGSGDFTQVGSTDLVLQNTDGSLGVWYMDGLNLVQGTLLNPGNPGDSDWRVAGTVDLNKDGKTDLLFQHADGSVATWLMDGIDLSVGELLNPSNPGPGWKLVGPK